MGEFRIYNGTTWVNPCNCNVHIRAQDNSWKLLDPASCPTRYWDGTQWCLIECEGAITSNTEINIWFDDSGSMDSTLPPLQAMIASGGALYNCLIQLYNNDPVLFAERVKVLNFSDVPTGLERFIPLLATERNFNRTADTSVTQVINITFADESDRYGYGVGPAGAFYYLAPFWDGSSPLAGYVALNGGIPAGDPYIGIYQNDVTTVRNVQNDPSITYDIKGIAFHIASIYDETGGDPAFCSDPANFPYPRPSNVAPCPTCTITSTPSECFGNQGQPTWPSFGDLVQATFIDNGAYNGNDNLSQYFGTKYVYDRDVDEAAVFGSNTAAAQAYYADKVVAKLNQLGISLTC